MGDGTSSGSGAARERELRGVRKDAAGAAQGCRWTLENYAGDVEPGDKTVSAKTLASVLILVAAAIACAGCMKGQRTAVKTEWPAREWAKSEPQQVGLDEATLAALDADLRSGKYSLVDSFAAFRCGK